MIPMMIFVHVTPQERPLPLTLQAISRYMVLRGESRPAVIPEEQMERFRFMLDYSPEAVEICSTPLAAGDAVKVIKGPLAGLEGELITVNGKSKVAVRLDMLGVRACGCAYRICREKGGGNGRTKRTKRQKKAADGRTAAAFALLLVERKQPSFFFAEFSSELPLTNIETIEINTAPPIIPANQGLSKYKA